MLKVSYIALTVAIMALLVIGCSGGSVPITLPPEAPQVTGINPNNAEAGDNMTGVTVTGNDFEGPDAQVKLKMDGEPDIPATNVSVVNEATITCDINIPLDAQPGLYYVEVTNSGGLSGIGEGLFTINSGPAPQGWARTWGGGDWDIGRGVAIDGSGNVYITGYFTDTADFDPGPGIEEHTSHGEKDVFLGKFDSAGEFQWARTWGGSSNDYGDGVAIDGSGNAYITGYFTDTADFDPGPGVDEHSSNGSHDIFLSKFDSAGDFQWARTWGGGCGYEVAIDGSGNAFVTGYFTDTADFDPGPGVDEHSSNGSIDIFLSKFDSAGVFQWARSWGDDGQDRGYGVAIDGSGNAYITGHCVDDIFLSKFDSAGVFQWTRTWGGADGVAGDEVGYGITIDGSGNAYITGHFMDTVDFDPGPGVDEHISNGSHDIFLSKFDSAGVFQWARSWGGIFHDSGYGVAIDGSDNAYITGYFMDTVDFDPGPGVDENTSNNSYDIFLGKFDSAGVFQWARTWGGSYPDAGRGVAVDGSDNVYIAGYSYDTVDFDPGPGIDEHTSNGDCDIFLNKFLPNGYWE